MVCLRLFSQRQWCCTEHSSIRSNWRRDARRRGTGTCLYPRVGARVVKFEGTHLSVPIAVVSGNRSGLAYPSRSCPGCILALRFQHCFSAVYFSAPRRRGRAARGDLARRRRVLHADHPQPGRLVCFFSLIYGTFNPSAPYWDHVPLGLDQIPIGLLSLLADQEFGLLANAPVHILWAAGVWSLLKRDYRLAAELMVIVVPYVIAVSGFAVWFGGGSPPARFLVPVVFPVGLALATLWARQDGAGRSLSLGLLGLSVLIAAVLAFGDDGGLADNLWGRPRPLVGLERSAGRSSARPSKFLSSRRRTRLPHTGDDCASRDTSDRVEPVAAGWLDPVSSARRKTSGDGRSPSDGESASAHRVALGVTARSLREVQNTSTRSQLRLLRSDDPRQRSSGVRLPRVRILPAAEARAQLALTTSRLDDPPPGALLYLSDVPSGEYQLRVKRGPTAHGDFSSASAGAMLRHGNVLSDGSTDTLRFHLPLVASSVVVNGDAAATQFVEQVALLPAPPRAKTFDMSDARARDAARYGDLVVFTVDDRAILDARGLWVLAGRQPEVVVTTDKPFNTLDLELRNVSVANRVGIWAGRWWVERSLAPDEVWRVSVPVVGLGRSFRMGFKVESGLPLSKGCWGVESISAGRLNDYSFDCPAHVGGGNSSKDQ